MEAQDVSPGMDLRLDEVALVPVRRLKDRLLWRWPGYRDAYWERMTIRARVCNTVLRVDRANHQIIIEHGV